VQTFAYSAKDTATGKVIKAQVQAETQRAAANLLLERDLIPLDISLKGDSDSLLSGLRNRVRTKDKILFTRQLATLINAGLPLSQSLRTVAEQTDSKSLRVVIDQIVTDVEGGSSLSNAFGQHEKVFNQVYVNLVAAGESSGTLDETLERLATQQEKDAAIVSKIRGALTYPIIVVVVIVGVLVFLLTTVLPQIAVLYEDLNKDLPLATAIMVAIANFIINFWYVVLLLVAGAIYAAFTYARTNQGKRTFDRIRMRMPLFGDLFMLLYMARFARTASTLLTSGVPMLETLNISGKAVNNVHIGESLERAANKVKSGTALSKSIEGDTNFLRLVPQMIRIGEQSGSIDAMLAKIASFYEDELDNKIKAISTIIEPALMIMLAVVVGIIVAAILLPVYGLVGDSLAL
jgi:type IV pilus assembly protein PilC